jgi:hypothetical protein
LTEEERVAGAKEKLSVLLTRKAQESIQRQALLQMQQQQKRVTDHDINDFMSKYCGGPETIAQQYPMPGILSAPPLPSVPPPAEPALSSALAKLRAKKAARAAGVQPPPPVATQQQPPPLMLALEKLRKIHEPSNPMMPQPPLPAYPYPSGGRISPQSNKRPAPGTDMEFENYKRLRMQVFTIQRKLDHVFFNIGT